MKNQKKNPVRIVWLLIGFLAMGLGAVGVVLPVLPDDTFSASGVFLPGKRLCEVPQVVYGHKII